MDSTKALIAAERAFEEIRLVLIKHLNEPERSAFWKAVAARDAIRTALADQGEAPQRNFVREERMDDPMMPPAPQPIGSDTCLDGRVVPIAWMNHGHIKAYQDGKEGISWASPQQTEFYSEPVYLASPAPLPVDPGDWIDWHGRPAGLADDDTVEILASDGIADEFAVKNVRWSNPIKYRLPARPKSGSDQ